MSNASTIILIIFLIDLRRAHGAITDQTYCYRDKGMEKQKCRRAGVTKPTYLKCQSNPLTATLVLGF